MSLFETPLQDYGLIHGAGNRERGIPSTDEITPEWIRHTLADVRRIVAAGMADRVRLHEADQAMGDALPDESDRECRHMGQPDLFAEKASVAPPKFPDAPSPLPGAADPAAIPPELVPWLRRGRTATASLFATVSHVKSQGTWYVVIPIYVRRSGEPTRFGVFRTEVEAVRAAIARFGPTPPVAPANRNQGKGRRVISVPAESETERGRKAAAREWMLLRREWLKLPGIVK